MKVSSQQYARVLVESVKENNILCIAKSFWYKLQKNGQYKDLPKIISALDGEYAKLNNVILAQVYSEKDLSNEQLATIERRIQQYSSSEVEKSKTKILDPSSRNSNNKIIIRNIIKKDIAGIIVKVDDTEINLSLENKIKMLKQSFNAH